MAGTKKEEKFNPVGILSAAGSIISSAASDASEKGNTEEAEYMRTLQSKLFALEVMFEEGLIREVRPRKNRQIHGRDPYNRKKI